MSLKIRKQNFKNVDTIKENKENIPNDLNNTITIVNVNYKKIEINSGKTEPEFMLIIYADYDTSNNSNLKKNTQSFSNHHPLLL
jgi:hypothetical protein